MLNKIKSRIQMKIKLIMKPQRAEFNYNQNDAQIAKK